MSKEKQAVQEVIERAYIQGIHGDQDEALIRAGFHPDFQMLVWKEMGFEKVNVDTWLKRLEVMIAENPTMWSSPTTYEFHMIDVTGKTAVAKLDVFKGEIHFSTDTMLLYKYAEGWRIVSKIYDVPA